MTRQSRMWLAAATGVAVVVAVVVLIFGYVSPPQFPSLYEAGAPTIEGSVAHVDFGPEECVQLLDVATGESHELYCDNWVWPESWDEDGNLRVHAGNGREHVWVLDPNTGTVLGTGDLGVGPQPYDASLRSRSAEGRAKLMYGTAASEVTLIDVAAPGNYSFYLYGITADGEYAWACDSEDRLVVVALDASGGPWLVAEGISEPVWK